MWIVMIASLIFNLKPDTLKLIKKEEFYLGNIKTTSHESGRFLVVSDSFYGFETGFFACCELYGELGCRQKSGSF